MAKPARRPYRAGLVTQTVRTHRHKIHGAAAFLTAPPLNPGIPVTPHGSPQAHGVIVAGAQVLGPLACRVGIVEPIPVARQSLAIRSEKREERDNTTTTNEQTDQGFIAMHIGWVEPGVAKFIIPIGGQLLPQAGYWPGVAGLGTLRQGDDRCQGGITPIADRVGLEACIHYLL